MKNENNNNNALSDKVDSGSITPIAAASRVAEIGSAQRDPYAGNEFYKPPLQLILGPSNQLALDEYELLALVKCWAELLRWSDLEWFLFASAPGDDSLHVLGLMTRVLGPEKVQKVVDEVYAEGKASNPTLWKIWETGTEAEWDFVREIVDRALSGSKTEVDIEALVKAALEQKQAS